MINMQFVRSFLKSCEYPISKNFLPTDSNIHRSFLPESIILGSAKGLFSNSVGIFHLIADILQEGLLSQPSPHLYVFMDF